MIGFTLSGRRIPREDRARSTYFGLTVDSYQPNWRERHKKKKARRTRAKQSRRANRG